MNLRGLETISTYEGLKDSRRRVIAALLLPSWPMSQST